jgi:hypothetical protein
MVWTFVIICNAHPRLGFFGDFRDVNELYKHRIVTSLIKDLQNATHSSSTQSQIIVQRCTKQTTLVWRERSTILSFRSSLRCVWHTMANSDGFKITIVGDGAVGKTWWEAFDADVSSLHPLTLLLCSILKTFAEHEFPSEYVPTVWVENYDSQQIRKQLTSMILQVW